MNRLIFNYHSWLTEIKHYIRASDWYNFLNKTQLFSEAIHQNSALFGFYQVCLHFQISVLSVLDSYFH